MEVLALKNTKPHPGHQYTPFTLDKKANEQPLLRTLISNRCFANIIFVCISYFTDLPQERELI